MNTAPKFEIQFDPGAYREYEKLDGSIVGIVDKKLEELEYRADEIGKALGNTKNTKLAGCREIKLRDAGIRIVYCITNEKVHILRIVYILTIEKRADDYVFKLADKRHANMKHFSTESLPRKK
jgi:mRNA interferase RelE/StbE